MNLQRELCSRGNTSSPGAYKHTKEGPYYYGLSQRPGYELIFFVVEFSDMPHSPEETILPIVEKMPVGAVPDRWPNIRAIWQTGMRLLEEQTYSMLRPPLYGGHTFRLPLALTHSTPSGEELISAVFGLYLHPGHGVFTNLYQIGVPSRNPIGFLDVSTYHSTNLKNPGVALEVSAEYNGNGYGTGLALLAEALCQLYADFLTFRSQSVTMQVYDHAQHPGLTQLNDPHNDRRHWTSYLLQLSTGWQQRPNKYHDRFGNSCAVYTKAFYPQHLR